MNVDDENSAFVGVAFSDETVVYRGLRKSKMVDEDGELDLEVYFRRPIETGLSVGLDAQHSRESFGASINLKKCYGALSLLVKEVREVDLDVINDKPNHGEIREVPIYDANNKEVREKAERISTLLLERSRWKWPHPKSETNSMSS